MNEDNSLQLSLFSDLHFFDSEQQEKEEEDLLLTLSNYDLPTTCQESHLQLQPLSFKEIPALSKSPELKLDSHSKSNDAPLNKQHQANGLRTEQEATRVERDEPQVTKFLSRKRPLFIVKTDSGAQEDNDREDNLFVSIRGSKITIKLPQYHLKH